MMTKNAVTVHSYTLGNVLFTVTINQGNVINPVQYLLIFESICFFVPQVQQTKLKTSL